MGGAEWHLKLRVGTAMQECTLSRGGETGVRSCMQAVVQESGLDQPVQFRFGFPPRTVKQGSELDCESYSLASLGMRNRDVLVVEPSGASGTHGEIAQKQGEASRLYADNGSTQPEASTSLSRSAQSRASRTKAKQKRKFPGVGKRLGGEASANEAVQHMNEDVMNAPQVQEIAGDENTIASSLSTDMLNAVTGNPNASSDKKALKRLHGAFRNALEERLHENEGSEKAAAALHGRFQLQAHGNGKVEVKYKGGDSRRKWCEETVDDLPAAVVIAVLKSIASSSLQQDAIRSDTDTSLLSEYIRKPESVAAASPRIFWGIVRHGRVSEDGRSFSDALRELAPVLPVDQVGKRKRKLPDRYEDSYLY